ncbi:MAG: VanW family protein [Candidatus Uhrbacteria bacterium]|nr:VanW family protein [Candidatus Uhrbacteria bacterium]
MKSLNPNQHQSIRSTFRLVGMIFCACLIVGLPVSSWAYSTWYSDKIFPGVIIADKIVGGKSKEYSEDILREYSDHLQSDGAVFRYGKKVVTLYPQSIPLGSDIPTDIENPLFDIDIDRTKNLLFTVGRSGSFIQQQGDRAVLAFFSRHFKPIVTIDTPRLTEALKNEFSFFHSPAHNASYQLGADGELAIKKESSGIEFNYDHAQRDLDRALQALSAPIITLTEKIAQPDITVQDIERKKTQVETILTRAPLALAHPENMTDQATKKNKWSIPRTEIISWLLPVRTADESIHITLDTKKIRAYLDSRVAPDVFVPVRHPRFEMQDGKVIAFELAQKGQQLDTEKTARDIANALLQETPAPVFITTEENETSYTDPVENNLDITELLTHNETSFAGSPTNRRKNITRGAALINGLLIAPGEDFSLVKALGNIDKTNGFLPELVIKGNETKPEFGGGLCQVSTTLFRAVSYAGLAVLERRNHSYRVSYYEPPVGFDATIYDPAPDFRFKNDTKNYILIQSSVKGNSMIVELWGTKDGRRVEIDKPTVFNIKKPAETKIIETLDLPPGKKKCTERAHNGADAVFERRIFYADGTTKKETYKSHYVVWPAVCLVGKKPEEPPASSAIQASSPETPVSQTDPSQISTGQSVPPDTINGSAP